MKAQLEEQARAEEERRQAEKGDNARERALDQMMGGVLEVKKEDELRKEIPVPMFMQVNECPDKLFTYTRFLEKIYFSLCVCQSLPSSSKSLLISSFVVDMKEVILFPHPTSILMSLSGWNFLVQVGGGVD